METWSAAVTLIFIMDPLGNLPIFMSTLKSIEPKRRRLIIIRELLFSLGLMMLFLFSGQAVLDFISVKQETVSIAGGIILFLIALRMIFPAPKTKAPDEQANQPEPFLVPLAIPLIAGPSLLATLILLSNQDPSRMFDWTIAAFVAWGVTAVILLFSGMFHRLLGERGLIAVERLMGMILVMIAIQMLLDGVASYLEITP
ncbi:UPF0056 membrane protein [Saliniradius amylolyticus]|uniref:UPF0056 membrane protein n=1 Tax=Saliniradius amylolyticus TaxID=2183582 RepID=A0A2S2E0P9_9ALTE|nr:YhgN family NAAT transporter [Saliniradius amylolyticus]AWL10860.1 UPF0056 membrane protein [Saliniradius amylolyticus]